MMKRDECFRVLARHVTDEVIVSTYSSAVDWLNLGERTLNYFSVGAMGLDSSHALGLALGRPGKRIICLQGDGSLLMNLGCLVTIAAAAPKNLVHIVVQNGTYEANGGHPIPNTETDFAAMARAAGYVQAYDFSELQFATLRVERSGPLTYDYPNLYDPARRKALKVALQQT
jgi:thiamine pyrophosphate-dependent acetolactate synthase large subunit-like protein